MKEKEELHSEVKKFLKKIQSKGGKSTLAKYGKNHFSEMGKKSKKKKKIVIHT